MIEVIRASLPYLAVVILGKILFDRQIFNDHTKDSLAKIIFVIVFPALNLITLLSINIRPELLKYTLFSLVVSTTMIIVAWFISRFLNFDRKKTGATMIAFGSVSLGTIVYPLADLNFGSAVQREAILFDAAGNFLYLMVGCQFIAQWYTHTKTTATQKLIQVAKTPVTIAIILGLTLSLIGFHNREFESVLTYITAGYGFPLALLVGMNLSFPKAKHLSYIFGIVVGRVVLSLSLFVIVLLLIPFEPNQYIALMLSALGPVTAGGMVLVHQYHLDKETYSQYVTASLIISLIGFPILISLLK